MFHRWMARSTRLLKYPVVTMAAAIASANGASAQYPTTSQSSGIGYLSVAAAFEALRQNSGVKILNENGWTVIDDRPNLTVWSFVPKGHPAYPAVVRRQVIQKGGGLYVNTNVLCEASKTSCDKLVTEFQALNNKMRDNIKKGTRTP